MSLEPIPALPGLWRIEAETNGYLLVRGGESLLIDCPSDAAAGLAARLEALGLPAPRTVLHTQVRAEHCGEWQCFPAAGVYVSADCADLARLSDAFYADCRTVWPADRNWEYRGRDRYGIGGCLTERPPARPLNVAGLLRPEEPFRWQGETFDVIPLSGSGKYAIGLFWREQRVLFSGDTVYRGGHVVNVYDLERAYGLNTGYADLMASLRRIRRLEPSLLLPTTGPLIDDPAGDIARLHDRVQWMLSPPARRGDEPPGQLNYKPLREFGRYREILPGLCQNNNWGAVILFVDEAGRGLMVDPDNCVWRSWDENCREFHADLDRFEAEMGLKTVECAVLTHYHGDHLEYANLLRERYGTTVVATHDIASLCERPEASPCCCMLPWFDFPFASLPIDHRIPYDQVFDWHAVPFMPIRTAGHCWAHSSHLVEWRGTRVLCTGDFLQYDSGPIRCPPPMPYSDAAWPDRGYARFYRKVAALAPELVLCGHGQSFFDRDGSILRDFVAVGEASLQLAREMVGPRDLLRAMTPPGFDEARPSATLE